MSFKFNPTTGRLELSDETGASGITFFKTDVIVDPAFLINKELIATTSPDLNTVVALSGNTLTISATGLASTTIKWTAFASITTVTFYNEP